MQKSSMSSSSSSLPQDTSAPPTQSFKFVTEIPGSLKLLVRKVVRGFYIIEDVLIVDLLLRNACMKDDDIGELLRFEKKQLRARLSALKSDKVVQSRLKMETGADGKAQKATYYYVNYKSFVNVVKYKLDIIRKRMETEERDATSRASFKCMQCLKTFTDLEADQLFDFTTQQFMCTYCGSLVEEDPDAMPKKDSRLMLAHYNEQMQPLFELLKEVEFIKLAPALLEPEPVDLNTIRGLNKANSQRPEGAQWSGEATRNQNFGPLETRVEFSIGNESSNQDKPVERKDCPIWMSRSTVITSDKSSDFSDSILNEAAESAMQNGFGGASGSSSSTNSRNKKESEEFMSVLMQFERKQPQSNNSNNNNNNTAYNNNKTYAKGTSNSSASSDEDVVDYAKKKQQQQGSSSSYNGYHAVGDNGDDNDDDDDEFDDAPLIYVADRAVPVNRIAEPDVHLMTPQQRENYIHIFQQHYSHLVE